MQVRRIIQNLVVFWLRNLIIQIDQFRGVFLIFRLSATRERKTCQGKKALICRRQNEVISLSYCTMLRMGVHPAKVGLRLQAAIRPYLTIKVLNDRRSFRRLLCVVNFEPLPKSRLASLRFL